MRLLHIHRAVTSSDIGDYSGAWRTEVCQCGAHRLRRIEKDWIRWSSHWCDSYSEALAEMRTAVEEPTW